MLQLEDILATTCKLGAIMLFPFSKPLKYFCQTLYLILTFFFPQDEEASIKLEAVGKSGRTGDMFITTDRQV